MQRACAHLARICADLANVEVAVGLQDRHANSNGDGTDDASISLGTDVALRYAG